MELREKKELKKLFYAYTDFSTLQGIGSTWIQQIKGYIPVGQWIATASVYQIALWALNIHFVSYWMLVAILAVKFYVMIFVNWAGGKIAIKVGLLRAQQQYSAKSEHLSPYNSEVIKTLKSICEKLGAESHFTDL